jgi:succinoglycan biosynthesis transport protein ExoP
MEKQLEELKAKMERSSAALAQFERELNVINPEEKTSILSARLLQLNTEYTNAQTDRVRKEAAWKSVQAARSRPPRSPPRARTSRRSLRSWTTPARSSPTSRRITAPIIPNTARPRCKWKRSSGSCSDSRKNAAQRVEVEYRESVNRESMLQKAVSETKAEFDRLNASSFEYQSLKREADADKTSMRSWSARSRKPASTPDSRTAPSASPIRPAPPSSRSSPT